MLDPLGERKRGGRNTVGKKEKSSRNTFLGLYECLLWSIFPLFLFMFWEWAHTATEIYDNAHKFGRLWWFASLQKITETNIVWNEKKKVEESCSCWIDFLLSPAYFPDSGKAGARGVWWVCGGGGGLNGNRMTLYSPTVAVDLCLQLTCASPIIYLASLCFVMFTCSSDIVKLAVIVCALAYMSTR